jgi:predicted ester cyclase
MSTTETIDHGDIAKRALEVACSGELEVIDEVYSPSFVDHVNSMEYHGTDGARKSVALYLALFPDLQFTVDEQVTEGDRVASRWRLRGTHRGRPVELWGIVISRLEDGKIAEDWAASDSLSLLRQLGLWRSVLLVAKHWRLLRA